MHVRTYYNNQLIIYVARIIPIRIRHVVKLVFNRQINDYQISDLYQPYYYIENRP